MAFDRSHSATGPKGSFQQPDITERETAAVGLVRTAGKGLLMRLSRSTLAGASACLLIAGIAAFTVIRSQVPSLANETSHTDVHTVDHNGGEIRGELLPHEHRDAHSRGAPIAQHALEVTMRDVDNRVVGTVTLQSTDTGAVRVTSRVEGLAAHGFHGFHLHENAVCEPDAPHGPFTTAGEHYNPGGTDHGEHAGDLPPLLFHGDGNAEQTVVTDRFTLEQLMDDGGAFIVHEDPNNLAHIPDRYRSEDAASPGPDEETLRTGDAGDRIACGAVSR